MINKKVYYKRLDYIRVISCIMIFLYHLHILQGGFLAVCTFFTLSGYLSCLSALKKEDFSLKKYYHDRLKKIYIPLLVVVSLTIILSTKVFNPTWINMKKETLSVIFGYNNYWQLSASMDYFTKHIASPFTHLWFISMLMQFELLFPLVFIGLRKLKETIHRDLSLLIVAILFITTITYFYYISGTQNVMPVYYNSFARSFSFLGGILLMILTYYFGNKLIKLLRQCNRLVFLIYVIALLCFGIFVSDKSGNYALFMILTTFISMRLIKYSTLKNSRTKPSLITQFISNNSYEIYLVQFPVIFFFDSVNMNGVLKTILIIVITIIVSACIHFISNFNVKNMVLKITKIFVVTLIIIIGTIFYIGEKDKSIEMSELEKLLNKNLKTITEKNKENIEKIENQQVKEEQPQVQEKTPTENNSIEITDSVSEIPVVGIGDSVMLGAVDALYEKFPNGYFDGKVSRTILEAEDVIEELKNKGALGDTLILALANNGDYRDWICEELMEYVGDRQVYWITAVLADDPEFNTRFSEFAKNYPNIHIVDWEAASKDHPEYFYADGIHLKPDGMYAYAEVIYNAIYGN
ncbi:MAG: acyltransferase [Bacilli bacterium]|nr:acyltransferase [Bacilli bacterium]